MKKNGHATNVRPPVVASTLAPPSHDAVEWECSCPASSAPVVVRVQTWFEAREQGAALLGVQPSEVEVKRKPADRDTLPAPPPADAEEIGAVG